MYFRHCLLTAALFLSYTIGVHGQNYIGMCKEQIIKVMKETDRYSKLNTTNVNLSYNYLKYEDRVHEITTLFFLSPGDTCTLIRKMYDYSNINDAIAELNSKYKPDGKNKWIYIDEGKAYTVSLAEDDWFFTVTTQLKKKGK